MANDKNLDENLVQQVAQLELPEVPADVVTAAVDCIIDTIAAAIGGAGDEVTQLAATVAESPGPCSLLGQRSCGAPRSAALLNGIAAHVLDFDDWVAAAQIHPSAPLLPAALAQAQALPGVSGDRLLLGYIAGFEGQARIGEAVSPVHYEAGFHQTATVGIFGAALAAARIQGADAELTETALGLASVQAAGSRAAFGTAAKSIQVGRAAEAGLLSAQLAAAGATGPRQGVFGPRGFGAIHGHLSNPGVAGVPFAQRWYLREALVKRHASCFGTHAPIEAILSLRDQCPVERVERIELTASELLRTVCAIDSPATPLEGKFSLAFTSALALRRGQCGTADFTEDSVRDLELVELAKKVELNFDRESSPQFARVAITLDDGSSYAAEWDSAVAPAPAERSAIAREKLRVLAGPVLGGAGAERLLAVLEGLPEGRPVAELTAALAGR